MLERNFQDAFVRFDGAFLELGNDCFRRRFDLSAGSVRTLELTDGEGKRFGGENTGFTDFSFYGDRCPPEEMRYSVAKVAANVVGTPRFDAPHLKVTVSIFEAHQQLRLRRDFYIYPKLAALGMRNRIVPTVYPLALWPYRRKIRESFQKNARPGMVFEGCVDSIVPPVGFAVDRAVEFRGRTDFNDEQVVEHRDEAEEWNGNLLFWRNSAGDGFFYLQEAPPSEERRDMEEYDFRFDQRRCFSCGWGVTPGEMQMAKEYISPRHVLFIHHRGEDEIQLLRQYQKRRFPCRAEKSTIMVNPWGSGGFYKRNSPDFLLAEIAATARCGAEVYQIDDSWQRGGVLGDLTGRNRHVDPEQFWKISEKLWGGDLSRPAQFAREQGVKLGLWIAPSGNLAYRNWRFFVRLFLDFSRRFQIDHFKLDALHLASYEADRNLELMLRAARRQSGGRIAFQIDMTGWGQRQGYFRFLEHGMLFLENRYVNDSSGIGYHPERTWRNVWRLAEYNRLQNLQIEVPNRHEINSEFYRKKNESNPATYPWEYWIAIALFANVLLWFAPSLLPEADQLALGRLMAWRKLRARDLDDGEIYRFGQEPDGTTLSGVYAVPPDDGERVALLVAFREAAGAETAVVELPRLPGNWLWRSELGDGEMQPLDNRPRQWRLRVANSPGFVVLAGTRL